MRPAPAAQQNNLHNPEFQDKLLKRLMQMGFDPNTPPLPVQKQKEEMQEVDLNY